MSRPPHDQFALNGTVLDQKFRVERVVAEGGFAVVYYATQAILDRPVALKVLKTPDDVSEETRKRFIDGFIREAKTIVRINHAHIVQVLDFGVSKVPSGVDAPWMALEWLDGHTLSKEIAQRQRTGGFTAVECLDLLRPVFEAVAYAHLEGIAHRDIKPANLMIVASRRGPVLKLLDFGIAKLMDSDEQAGSGDTRTHSASTAYSLHYAAPEQLGGTRTGPWTDVHALALVLTNMLTGEAPYVGADRTEICASVLSSDRPTPARWNVDAGSWEPILRKALSLRAADRFKNASEFLAALEKSVGGAANARDGVVARANAGSTTSAEGGPTIADAVHHTTLRGAVTTQQSRMRRESGTRWMLSVAAALVAVAGLVGWMLLRDDPSSAAAHLESPVVPPARAPVAAPTDPIVANTPVTAPVVAPAQLRSAHGRDEPAPGHTPAARSTRTHREHPGSPAANGAPVITGTEPVAVQ